MEDAPSGPRRGFPLILRVSRAVTPVLVRSPLSPNQITLASLDVVWALLPCAPIGAQVCWIMGLSSLPERYHV